MTGLNAKCPGPGCTRKPGRGKLMCGPCWGAVPPDVQRRVHVTYRAWLRELGNADVMREYRDACAAAIEAV